VYPSVLHRRGRFATTMVPKQHSQCENVLTFPYQAPDSGAMDTKPTWIAIHPALTEDRLVAISSAIIEWRHKKLARKEAHDSGWNLGCDQYRWACFGLEEASKGEHKLWLSTKRKGLVFTILVGGVPLKMFREGVPGQPFRASRRTSDENEELQLAFPKFLEPLPPDGVLRLAIETNKNEVVGVSLIELDSAGKPVYQWPIPVSPIGVVAISEPVAEPVDLGEPPVGDAPRAAASEPEVRVRRLHLTEGATRNKKGA